MRHWCEHNGGGHGVSGCDHVVTSTRVISPISGDSSNLLIERDLFQQVGQHRGIANVACGDTNRVDLQCFFVHTEMELAPQALLWPAMLACVPLALRDLRYQDKTPSAYQQRASLTL